MKYTSYRYWYKYGNEDDPIECTDKEWDNLDKAIAYAHRYATGIKFESVEIEDENGKVVYRILQDSTIEDYRNQEKENTQENKEDLKEEKMTKQTNLMERREHPLILNMRELLKKEKNSKLVYGDILDPILRVEIYDKSEVIDGIPPKATEKYIVKMFLKGHSCETVYYNIESFFQKLNIDLWKLEEDHRPINKIKSEKLSQDEIEELRKKYYSEMKVPYNIKGPTDLPIGEELFKIYDLMPCYVLDSIITTAYNYEEVKKSMKTGTNLGRFFSCFEVAKIFTKDQAINEAKKIEEYYKQRFGVGK